ncbi:hypothetical protein Tsubulata_038752 [Turnera subulata]|uniref:Rapid ALkalinization Factor n=1 Tax=Turnera subulata TaxID=218843 RepID=A0A9Q0F783_9ROSI|nr:hypothetical protein Tsubulata_038752 [Turnera subulata]
MNTSKKIFLLGLYTIMIYALLAGEVEASQINYADLQPDNGRGCGPTNPKGCSETPENSYHRGCEREDRCREG